MIEFTIGIILGLFIGGILTTIGHHAELVGTLHIMNGDDKEPIGLYVELNNEVKYMQNKRYVTMKIRENNTGFNEKQ